MASIKITDVNEWLMNQKLPTEVLSAEEKQKLTDLANKGKARLEPLLMSMYYRKIRLREQNAYRGKDIQVDVIKVMSLFRDKKEGEEFLEKEIEKATGLSWVWHENRIRSIMKEVRKKLICKKQVVLGKHYKTGYVVLNDFETKERAIRVWNLGCSTLQHAKNIAQCSSIKHPIQTATIPEKY